MTKWEKKKKSFSIKTSTDILLSERSAKAFCFQKPWWQADLDYATRALGAQVLCTLQLKGLGQKCLRSTWLHFPWCPLGGNFLSISQRNRGNSFRFLHIRPWRRKICKLENSRSKHWKPLRTLRLSHKYVFIVIRGDKGKTGSAVYPFPLSPPLPFMIYATLSLVIMQQQSFDLKVNEDQACVEKRNPDTLQTWCGSQVAGRLNSASSLGLSLLWDRVRKQTAVMKAEPVAEERTSLTFTMYLKDEPSESVAFFSALGCSRTGGNGNVLEFYFFQTESYKGYLLALPHGLKYK